MIQKTGEHGPLTLTQVYSGSAMAAAGGTAFIGRVVEALNGVPVYTSSDVHRMVPPLGEVRFAFGAASPQAGRPQPTAPAAPAAGAWAPAGHPAQRPPSPPQLERLVVANVHSLDNTALNKVNIGVYHTGIVVYDVEWSYGTTGIYERTPAVGPSIRELNIGDTVLSPAEVESLIDELRGQWTAERYHIARNNCNNFCAEFLRRLGQGSGRERDFQLPKWINRAARSVRHAPAGLVKYAAGASGPGGSSGPSS